ncbi:hypothetical protein D9Q98_002627 [Chlorella vulgaris]|uniref:Dynein heavy chain C-terminal domain-containing protein n=1 Tax=Chlorella vulgaris TaxID=3077 RepID=A0A9D4TTK9_CHLVU|nr:hypothetical protein D9Q98_002627 [Chlorella vulgaris]
MLMDRVPENFDLEDIRGRVDEFTPYMMVAMQEAECWNVLLTEIRRSLVVLQPASTQERLVERVVQPPIIFNGGKTNYCPSERMAIGQDGDHDRGYKEVNS